MAPAPAYQPEDAEVVFEAGDRTGAIRSNGFCGARRIERHDASLLRLQTPVTGIAPLPMAKSLPVLEETARVYIIGHPGGRDLAFSFQDNELLDHEGPTARQAADPGRVPRALPRTDRGRQLRQPGVQRAALGGDRAAPQGRQDRHAQAQRQGGHVRRQRGRLHPVHRCGDEGLMALAQAGGNGGDDLPVLR